MKIFTEVVEQDKCAGSDDDHGTGCHSDRSSAIMLEIWECTVHMRRIWQSANCDLLFSIGTRFNDRITGKLHAFAPNAQIVHIDIDTASISRNIHVDVPIVADAREAIDKDD